MKKSKLSLSELNVQSFVTQFKEGRKMTRDIVGGAGTPTCSIASPECETDEGENCSALVDCFPEQKPVKEECSCNCPIIIKL